jgi:hypothetical protein
MKPAGRAFAQWASAHIQAIGWARSCSGARMSLSGEHFPPALLGTALALRQFWWHVTPARRRTCPLCVPSLSGPQEYDDDGRARNQAKFQPDPSAIFRRVLVSTEPEPALPVPNRPAAGNLQDWPLPRPLALDSLFWLSLSSLCLSHPFSPIGLTLKSERAGGRSAHPSDVHHHCAEGMLALSAPFFVDSSWRRPHR